MIGNHCTLVDHYTVCIDTDSHIEICICIDMDCIDTDCIHADCMYTDRINANFITMNCNNATSIDTQSKLITIDSTTMPIDIQSELIAIAASMCIQAFIGHLAMYTN